MKAVIIAAGKGNRMLPLTRTHPKPMLPVCNVPILNHIILNAKDAGITEFVIITNSDYGSIHEFFKDGKWLGVSIKYVTQKIIAGTANAIAHAQSHIDEDERFLVLTGDTIVSSEEIILMMKKDASTVIGTMIVEYDQCKYGVIELNERSVSKIIEKPDFAQTYLVNAGIYIFNPTIFDSISKTKLSVRNEYEITDSIQMIIDDGEKIPYHVFQDVMHISYPWDLLDYNHRCLSKLEDKKLIGSEVEFGANIKGPVIICKGAKIRSGTYIEGPVIIGQDSDIGPNSYIRPFTSIGQNVRIGSAVEVKNSIIMDDTHIGHLSYVGDSIIGANCNIGVSTQVANLRHDNNDIRVDNGVNVVNSHRRKLGTIMGDNVKTGANSTLNAGSIIEPNSTILPGEVVWTYHKSNKQDRKEMK